MRPASNNNTEIEIHDSCLDLADGDGRLRQHEALILKTRLENEINVSKKLKASLAERDRKIVELERTLKEAADRVEKNLAVIHRIRAGCEKDVGDLAQIRALQASTLDLCDSKIRELIDVIDEVEDGVRKIYRSRRWRFANIVIWIKGLFCSRAKRPFRGYWRIDTKLAEYRVLRDRHLGGND
jgi:hypothetical protein